MTATKVTTMLVGVKIVTNTSKKLLAVLVRLKIFLPYDPTIPTPRFSKDRWVFMSNNNSVWEYV